MYCKRIELVGRKQNTRLTLMACFTLSDKLATALVDEKNRPPETLALAAKAAA